MEMVKIAARRWSRKTIKFLCPQIVMSAVANGEEEPGGGDMRRSSAARHVGRVLIAAILSATTGAALAQEWKELRYDPPVGSRWVVETQSEEVDNRPDGVRTTHTKSRGELTIEAKTPTGFRIAYVTRDISIDGDAPSVGMMKPVLALFKDWELHAATDAAGKPTEIDNLADAKARAHGFVERTLDSFKGAPKIAEAIRPIFDSMLNVDGAAAAKAYLEEVSSLSAGQNTGLRLGETRQETSEVANPLGGAPIKTTATFKIAAVDSKSGAVDFIRDSRMDPEAMKQFALDFLQKLSAASDKPLPPNVLDMIKTIRLSIDEHDVIEAEGGVTRSIREEGSIVLNGMGHTLTKKTTRIITVTPAP